jgi:hypothetical protein
MKKKNFLKRLSKNKYSKYPTALQFTVDCCSYLNIKDIEMKKAIYTECVKQQKNYEKVYCDLDNYYSDMV